MKRIAGFALLVLFAAAPFLSAQPAEGIPKTLLPLPLLRLIINEASGDAALQNEILLAGVNRNRKAEEYVNGYFETRFILDKLKEYGITDSRIIDLPTRAAKTWDAEAGELWIVKPAPRKIADLKEVPASLCSGSATLDRHGRARLCRPGQPGTLLRGQGRQGQDRPGQRIAARGPADGRGEVRRPGHHRLFVQPSRIRSRRSRLERDQRRGGDEADDRLHGFRAPGARLPRSARARGQDRGAGLGQDPDGALQGTDGRGRPARQGLPQRGAGLHRPSLRGLRQAGGQRQHQRLRGHPGNGPDPAQADGRWEDPAAQTDGPLPLHPGDLRDFGLSAGRTPISPSAFSPTSTRTWSARG